MKIPPTGQPSRAASRHCARNSQQQELSGFIVPRADRHQNEYVAPCDERLAWLTGFSGSAGLAIVLADKAALFVDGRYTLQGAEQTDTAVFEVVPSADTTPEVWLTANLPSGASLGFDPWLHTAEGAERLAKACDSVNAKLVPVTSNPIDAIWNERPAPPHGRVVLHDLKFSGESAEAKLERIRTELKKLKANALVVTDPHAVAWTFNIRGSDVAHTPLVLAFAIIPAEERPTLFVDTRKLDNGVRYPIEKLANVRELDAFDSALAALGYTGSVVRLDSATAADCGTAHNFRSRRQAGARRRSDRRHEGGQECRRDHRNARGASARRRGGYALSGVAGARSALRQPQRD